MEDFTKITSKEQYHAYCKKHLALGKKLSAGEEAEEVKNAYYILDLIIQDYHQQQTNPLDELTPVDLLKALMEEYTYTGEKLSKELGISHSVLSEILNYKRGFSKEVIRKLSQRFNLNPASFLKPYELIGKTKTMA